MVKLQTVNQNSFALDPETSSGELD